MRIAIAGTHCVGKSTLIEAFLGSHPEYRFEPEAYEALQEIHGEYFGSEPSADDFLVQLRYQLERLRQFGARDRVIFERSPFDYVAYLQALVDLRRDTANAGLVDQSLDLAVSSVELLDLIVFLPASSAQIYVPEEEDRELREAMDSRLEALLIDDRANVFQREKPTVIQAPGTTTERLETLCFALESQ